MRFELLFDDLAAQLDARLAADGAHEHAEEERLRAARTTLRERLESLVDDAPIRVRLADGSVIDVVPSAVGCDWVAGGLASGAEAIVPLASIASVALDTAQLRTSRERMPRPRPGGALATKLGIGVLLRDLARRRVPLDVVSLSESAPLHGTVDRVGADHLDLAVHERGTARREGSVLEHRLIALAAVVMLRV